MSTDPIKQLPELVRQALADRRPILQHLNADSTWLVSLPVPSSHAATSSLGRRWYNILLDPWLSGPQSDVTSWFSTQWHAVPPAYGSIEEVQALCREMEWLAAHGSSPPSPRDSRPSTSGTAADGQIDAVAISHEFTDHCHKPTLLGLPYSTPIYASTKAAALVQSWKHFDLGKVIDMPAFSSGEAWRECEGKDLPKWVRIGRVINKQDALYYHSAVVIAFDLSSFGKADEKRVGDCIIYTPHGIHPPSLECVPPLRTLAFLHGLHDVSISWGQQLNLGAHNGLAAQRALKAKYWVATHDEVKRGGGIVSWFLRRKVYTVKEALGQEAEKVGEGSGDLVRETGFLEVGNGEGVVLA